MILRSLPLRTALLASVALSPLPLFAQAVQPSETPNNNVSAPYTGTVVEDIVARVNDQVISKSDYERAEQELRNEGQQQGWSQQQLYEQQHDLLRSLIDKQLLLSKAKQLDITGETDLVKRLDEIRKQNHLDTMEDLQKAAEAQGVSYEDFKEQIRENIQTSEVIRDEVGRHIQITPSEVQQYYDAHKDEFTKPEQERLSEILVPTANPDDTAVVSAAQKKADAIEAQLKDGTDFADLARKESGGPTAAEGGDLGDFKRGQLAKVLEDQTFDLQAGQYTQPIRTKQGFVILKVTNHQAGGVQPLANVETQVEDELGYAKMAPAMRDYLTKLREEAYIDIKPGYEDSGATPNEIRKPSIVYSAFTPPGPKKKKKIAKRVDFRDRGRHASSKKQQSAAALPGGVPTLDQVGKTQAASRGNAAKQVASTKSYTMKPGKKEKIRYGQAPRETLPAADTKHEDAGAQVASNDVPSSMQVLNPDGTLAAPPDEAKRQKTRFSDRAKQEQKEKKKAKKDKNKAYPFAPPPETTEEAATRQQQSQALGLKGDTSKTRSTDLSKTGPKRRYNEENKKKDEQKEQQMEQQPASSGTSPATPSAGTTNGSGNSGTNPTNQ